MRRSSIFTQAYAPYTVIIPVYGGMFSVLVSSVGIAKWFDLYDLDQDGQALAPALFQPCFNSMLTRFQPDLSPI